MIDELSAHVAGFGEWTAVLIPLVLLAYFAPVLIAVFRGHRFSAGIGVINLVLGWTVVGWIAALVWAVNKDIRERSEVRYTLENYSLNEPSWSEAEGGPQPVSIEAFKKCRYCAEVIRAEAIVCRYCGRDLESAPAEADPIGSSLDGANVDELYRLLLDGENDSGRQYQEERFAEVFDQARMREQEPVQPESAPSAKAAEESEREVPSQSLSVRIVNLEPAAQESPVRKIRHSPQPQAQPQPAQEEAPAKAKKRYAGRGKG